MRRKEDKKKVEFQAYFEIYLMIISIFAFSFFISSVNAQETLEVKSLSSSDGKYSAIMSDGNTYKITLEQYEEWGVGAKVSPNYLGARINPLDGAPSATQAGGSLFEDNPESLRGVPQNPPSKSLDKTSTPILQDTAVTPITEASSSGNKIIDGKWLVTEGDTSIGSTVQATSIIDGKPSRVTIGTTTSVIDAQPLQSQFVTLVDGSKTSIYTALNNPTNFNDANLLKALNAKSITENSAGEKIIDLGGGAKTTISADGTKMVSTTKGSSMLSKFFGAAGGTGWDALLTGVEYAGLGWGAGQLIGSIAGMDEEQTKALSASLAAGAFTAKSLLTLESGPAHSFINDLPFNIGKMMLNHPFITGIIVGAIIYARMYKKTSTKTVTFECKPWQAPVGGADCEKCNNVEGCSEYKCKSLGQACQLLNPGTGQEKCAWVNPKDTKSPGISPWEDVLTKGYKYTDVRIRPPGEGSEPGRMRIVKNDGGCVEAFTPLEFGIVTMGPDNIAEPAQCRIDYNHTLKYEDMSFDFGESNLYLYNHSQKLRLPSPASIQAAAPELKHDGTYTLYVRCRDANGNENVDEFAIRFCVDKGPDTTPPKIEGTSIANGMPVKYNQSNVELEVYVNEPAECKWSRDDKGYNNMENTMSCSTNVWEMNNNMVYTCKTTLTGIKDRQENKFYFRCKDQPWAEEADRNVNMESYLFTLIGTEPLNIIDIKPNGTIKGSTDIVSVWLEVETANGYKNGEAVCYYSETTNEADWIEFFETGKSLHKQRLDLISGSYKYYVKCVDLGGNRDDNKTEFTVEVDRSSPIIARVYKENELLRIITIEDSECRYSTQSCNFKFEDGVDMPYANQTEHVAEWKTENTYYIRCSDEYGNLPLSNACSMIVRPYDIVEQKVEE